MAEKRIVGVVDQFSHRQLITRAETRADSSANDCFETISVSCSATANSHTRHWQHKQAWRWEPTWKQSVMWRSQRRNCALFLSCLNYLHCIGSRPSDHYFRSVCLFVWLCRVFLSRLGCDLDQTRTHVACPGLVVSPRIWGLCDPWGLGDPQKTCIFRGFGAAVNQRSVAASTFGAHGR